MAWIKNALLDLTVTVAIALAVTAVVPVLKWVVFIYTPLILVLKLTLLTSTGMKGLMQSRRKEDEPPSWFYHLLYAVNVGLLAAFGWWIWAGGWGAIWLFSFLIEQRMGRTQTK